MIRSLITIIAATAAMLTLVACSSGSDSSNDAQQQTAAEQPQQTEQQQSGQSTDAQDRSSNESSTQQPSQAEPSQAQEEEQAQAAAEQPQSTADSGASDEDASQASSPGGSITIVEPADYDALSPRLQLLRDGGYPVYVFDNDYTLALGTPDISPGEHRISVVIEGPQGLVEFPAIAVSVAPDAAEGSAQEVVARFARFPDGVRGFHVTSIDFTHAGRWNLILRVPAGDGFTDLGIALDVPEATSAPSVGTSAPASDSRTLTDVANIVDLSTGETPDPGLYLVSIADAVADNKPFVVVFASPGFCTNAFCGPQAEVLSEVRQIYGDAANYVHVDLYENPEQVRLGEEPIETPILEEWGLHTDEWTFVVDADGVVTARFEAFAPLAEVDAALGGLLDG